MNLSEFQREALLTDQQPAVQPRSGIGPEVMIPVLGLAGEAGSLLTEYKKYARDGELYVHFRERVAEELGDVLWYVANIASKERLDLDQVARSCLAKAQDRWGRADTEAGLFPRRHLDDGLEPAEQFPRHFRVELRQEEVEGRMVQCGTFEGKPFGSDLTDNRRDDDGYRFHDVFHLAYVAHLGWSPVMRKMMNRKRSDVRVDEIEDGGRAKVIDEAIVAIAFSNGVPHFYEGLKTVEYEVLRTIKSLTTHLEVNRFTMKEWERAILAGFDVWRAVRDAGGGVVVGDLNDRTLAFEPLPTGSEVTR